MKFYEKYYANNYDELITYYPRFYRDIFEMAEILKAHGRIADGIEENIEQTYRNGFLDYANEATISKLENFLKIGQNKNRTLEERRRLVKSYFVGAGKMSASAIFQIIAVYTDSPVICEFKPFDDKGNNRLYIEIQNSEEKTVCTKDIFAILSKRIPAHLLFCFASRWMIEIPVPVDIGVKLQLRSEFYPRYNVLPFLLDGSARLDGTYYLNGYLSGETLDFYPVVLRMIASADWRTDTAGTTPAQVYFRPWVQLEVKNDAVFKLWGAACAKVQTINQLFLYGSIEAETKSSNQLIMQGAAEERVDAEASAQFIADAEMEISQESALQVEGFADCEVKTDGTLIVEKDLWMLDGSVMLDGSRLLDAEIYEEEI